MNKTVFTYFVKEAAKQQKDKQMNTRDAALTGAGVGLGVGGGIATPLAQRGFVQDLKRFNPTMLGTVGEDSDVHKRVSPTMFKEMQKNNIGVATKTFAPQGAHAMFGKYVYSPKGSHEAVLAHEMGHATGIGANKAYQKAYGVAAGLGNSVRNIRNLGAMAAVPGLALANKDVSNEEAANNARLTRNIALGSTLTDAPVLFEEARATKRALQHGKFKKGKLNAARVLAPAFGTYLAQTLPTLGAAGGAELLRRKHKKKSALQKKK